MKQPANIILASSSLYRQALLQRLGIEFRVEVPKIDESPKLEESAIDLVLRLARQKAEKVGNNHNDVLVIGSDQVACLDKQILNKPGNRENARQQLAEMSGQTINFLTGLSLYSTSSNEFQSAVVPYYVSFRKFGPAEIERYLDIDQPYDCAGSFKSEQLGITLVSKMEGDDPSALMGLPLIKLSEMLRNQGFTLP